MVISLYSMAYSLALISFKLFLFLPCLSTPLYFHTSSHQYDLKIYGHTNYCCRNIYSSFMNSNCLIIFVLYSGDESKK